jgi:hypothetical protein
MSFLTLARSPDTAIANISAFNLAVESGQHPLVKKLISHVQAWYAVERPDGSFSFGPSKFIGYANMTPDLYAQETGANGRLDGRVTEKALSAWATPVTESDERYEALHDALAAFCGRHGSFPNKRARISLFRKEGGATAPTEADQVKALSVLILALSDEARKDLKRLIWP